MPASDRRGGGGGGWAGLDSTVGVYGWTRNVSLDRWCILSSDQQVPVGPIDPHVGVEGELEVDLPAVLVLVEELVPL